MRPKPTLTPHRCRQCNGHGTACAQWMFDEVHRKHRAYCGPCRHCNGRGFQYLNDRNDLICGECDEVLPVEQECQCRGTLDCICEFTRHHAGCCGTSTLLPADPAIGWKHVEREAI